MYLALYLFIMYNDFEVIITEILQLKYFYESAQSESFAKTAKKYMVPLSSVSIAIKHLEEELGVKLFDRTSNSVSLNDKGRQFYYSVKNIFDELNNGIINLSARDNDERQIKIFAKTTRETIAKHIRAFNAQYPNVKFYLDVNSRSENIDINDYDIIVDKKTDIYEGFESFDLRTFNVRVECLSSHPLCRSEAITLKQLKNQPFVTTGKDSECFEILSNACKKVGFLPNIILECNDYTCRDQCVASGMGLGVTLGSAIRSSYSQVQLLNISDFNEKFTARVYYKPSAYFGNVKAFIELIKSNLT